jgi:hypothetical protein
MSFNGFTSFNIEDSQLNLNQVNHKKIGEEFCKLYYQNMIKGGFSNVLGLFTTDAKCNFMDQEFIGAYNILVNLSQKQIHKFVYSNIYANYQSDLSNVLISASGNITAIPFVKNAGISKPFKFTETFILKNINGSYFITNYIFRLIN